LTAKCGGGDAKADRDQAGVKRGKGRVSPAVSVAIPKTPELWGRYGEGGHETGKRESNNSSKRGKEKSARAKPTDQ